MRIPYFGHTGIPTVATPAVTKAAVASINSEKSIVANSAKASTPAPINQMMGPYTR